MRRLTDVPHARPALLVSLAMGAVTSVHHLHAMRWVNPLGAGSHVLWTELVMLPLTLASMLVFVRTGNRFARGLFLAIAALGFAGVGRVRRGLEPHARDPRSSPDRQSLDRNPGAVSGGAPAPVVLPAERCPDLRRRPVRHVLRRAIRAGDESRPIRATPSDGHGLVAVNRTLNRLHAWASRVRGLKVCRRSGWSRRGPCRPAPEHRSRDP